MATTSSISLENPDHTVTSIYCHWDGYIEYNGKILLEHYTDYSIVNRLLQGGDLSSLKNTIDSCEYYDRSHPAPSIFANFEQFNAGLVAREYDYVYKQDHKWYVRRNFRNNKWELLEQVVSDLRFEPI